MSSTNVNALSDKEFFAIFDQLPMPDLTVHLQFVCRRWRHVYEVVCRSKTHLRLYSRNYRHDLKDVYGYWYSAGQTFKGNFTDVALCVNRQVGLSTEACHTLVSRFPNVKQLELIGVPIKEQDFAYFLQNWTNLERLAQLYEPEFPLSWISDEWKAGAHFWDAVEQLKSLRHLALPHEYLKFDVFERSILPQLESLHIFLDYDDNYEVVLDRIIERMQPRLECLSWTAVRNRVGSYELANRIGQIFNTKTYLFADQLTHFGAQVLINAELLEILCSEFRNLTHLSLLTDCSLVDMIPKLAKLDKLTCLRVVPKATTIIDYAKEDSGDDEPSEICQPTNIMMRSYTFLPEHDSEITESLGRIQVLHLGKVDFYQWNQLNHLAEIFPNIREIHFENAELHLRQPPRGFDRCKVLLLTLQVRFQFLRKIYRNAELLIDLSKVTMEPKLKTESSIKKLFRKRVRIDHAKQRKSIISADSSCCCSHLKSVLQKQNRDNFEMQNL